MPRSSNNPGPGASPATALNSAANSGPSVGASSLVTDANSSGAVTGGGGGGGPRLQRSASINTESYLRLPTSPASFTSNTTTNNNNTSNGTISGSSVVDGSSMPPKRSHPGGSTATSQPSLQGRPGSAFFTQDPSNLLHMQKKQRLDVKQDDILQQQVIQQLLQGQDSFGMQEGNPQLQALIHQRRLVQQRQQQQQQQQQHQQQQLFQSMSPLQRAQLQQQQIQLRQQLQQQQQPMIQPGAAAKRKSDNNVCNRRMMQYIYHLRYRPTDNNILYWRKFYAEYFSPHSKKRWCLSRYENVGHHNLGVFPQVAMDSWHCDICGSKRGRGFETTFEVLPRLAKIKFDSGVIDEFLFLEVGDEYILPSGMMMIEYGRAIQESVYEQLRVVREGQLRVTFTPDLKILKWEFCARRHEEFLHRRLVAPQVSQLMQVAQKYQNSLTDNGSSGASVQDLQSNCNMFMSIGRQLAKNLELQSLNDLGLSKRYVRCLQIAEVVNGMKDLIDFSQRNNMGPIESLKSYTRQTTAAKLQAQKLQMEQPGNTHGLPADQNTLNKVMGMHSGLSHNINHNQSGPGVLNNASQNPMALSNNYQPLLRQNSTNSITNSACTFDGSNQGQVSSLPGSISNTSLNTFSNPYRQNRLNLLHQQSNPQTTQVNQQLQEQMLQQVLQEMMNTNRGVQQQTPSRSTPNGNEAEDAFGGVSNSSGGMPMRTSSSVPGNVGFGNNMSASTNNIMSMAPSRTNSFQANAGISNPLSSNTAGTNAIGSNPDMLQGPHMATELLPGISHEFCENGLFSTDSGDMSYGWKV